MKIIILRSDVILCLCCALLMLFSCQKEEFTVENDTQLQGSEVSANGENSKDQKGKVDVCHKGRIINISSSAVSAHQGHGDAVDQDGDGYFDKDNTCSETDCNDNDPAINPGNPESCEPDNGSTAELLIGTWTSTTASVSVEIFIEGQPAIDYLIDVVGLSPEDAAARVADLEDSLQRELTGVLTINIDGTYESAFREGTVFDSGTWSLSADEMTLTLFEGPGDVILITINSISETVWNAGTADVIPLDVDGDPSTPDVDAAASATVIFTQ